MKHFVAIFIFILALVSIVSADGLKKSEVRAIAKQYINAIQNQDFNKWRSLMSDTHELDELAFKEMSYHIIFKSAEVEDVERTKTGYDVLIEFRTNIIVTYPGSSTSFHRQSHWLQMLPNGKIKYDLIYPHPIPYAMFSCRHAISRIEYWDSPVRDSHLELYGIPLFGFESDASVEVQLSALKEIRNWLKDEGDEWDRCEPKIACPEKLFKAGKAML